MGLPVHLLPTTADCDTVLASLQAELREYEVQESVLDLREDKATATATNSTTELATLDRSIAALNTLIPTLDAGSKIRFNNEVQLRQAMRRREDLTVGKFTSIGAAAFLQSVNLRQAEGQVAILQACIQEVTDHRATL